MKTHAYSRGEGMSGYPGTLHGLILAQVQRTQRPLMLFISGTTIVRFQLDRRGKLISFEVLRGSGHRSLDDFVELAVRQAAKRFPQPPSNYPGDRLSFAIPITFQ